MFIFGLSLQVSIMTSLLLGVLIAVAYILFILSKGKKTPDLEKRNYEKISDACLISVKPNLFDKPCYLETGVRLGRIIGSAYVTNLNTNARELVLRIERTGTFLSNLIPFLRTSILIRIPPQLIMDDTALDIIIKCDTVKRLDNYFYTPIINKTVEVENLKGWRDEMFKEHALFSLEKLAEMSEKAMKANPSFIQRKDIREGGLSQSIRNAVGEDD